MTPSLLLLLTEEQFSGNMWAGPHYQEVRPFLVEAPGSIFTRHGNEMFQDSVKSGGFTGSGGV